MKYRTCKSCSYPFAGKSCPNPACFANPNVSEETKADWRIRDAARLAEEAEREHLRRMRNLSFTGKHEI